MEKEEEVPSQEFGQLGLGGEHSQEEDEEEYTNGKWEVIPQPKETVPLFMVDFQHCDSKKCTGKKLQRFKLLTKIKDKKKKFRGIVLSAFAKKYVQKDDMEHIQKGGICVIDCSWNRIEETKEFRYKHERYQSILFRKLPFVVAGNPVNFGKPYQLSCAEALATALCAVGFVPQAKYIMSKFGWSEGFWKENPFLHLYADCKSMAEIQQQSKKNEENRSNGFQREYVFPSDSQQEEEEVEKEEQPVQVKVEHKEEE